MIWIVEFLKIFGSLITMGAAIVAITHDTKKNDGTLTIGGKKLVVFAVVGFILTACLQVAQYLNVLDNSRELKDRHEKLVSALSKIDFSSAEINSTTTRIRNIADILEKGAMYDPIPVNDIRIVVALNSVVQEKNTLEDAELMIRMDMWRAGVGSLSLEAKPTKERGFNKKLGYVHVGSEGRVATNIELFASHANISETEWNNSNSVAFIRVFVSDIEEARRRDGAEWPFKELGGLRLMKGRFKVTGTLSENISQSFLLINRQLRIDIPLTKTDAGYESIIKNLFNHLKLNE